MKITVTKLLLDYRYMWHTKNSFLPGIFKRLQICCFLFDINNTMFRLNSKAIQLNVLNVKNKRVDIPSK